MPIRRWQIEYFAHYPYHGSVLDLACGTGGIGMLIKKAGNNTVIRGIDISPLSLETEQVKKYYSSTAVGLLQDAIMSEGIHDHSLLRSFTLPQPCPVQRRDRTYFHVRAKIGCIRRR